MLESIYIVTSSYSSATKICVLIKSLLQHKIPSAKYLLLNLFIKMKFYLFTVDQNSTCKL